MRATLCVLLAAACMDDPPPREMPPGGNPMPDAAGPDAATGPSVDAAGGADAAPPGMLPDLTIDHYHSLDEIGAYLRAVAAARPDTVTFHVLGQSAEGR